MPPLGNKGRQLYEEYNPQRKGPLKSFNIIVKPWIQKVL